MDGALEHEVKIIIDIVSNLRQAARDIDTASEAVGGLGRSGDRAVRDVHKLADALDDVSKSARAASSTLGIDKASLREWDALETKVRAASEAYSKLSRARAASGEGPVDLGRFMADQNVSPQDLDNYRQGDSAAFLKDEAAARKQVAAASDDMAEASRRLSTIQRQRAESEAAEANRQMEIRAAIEQRARAERDLAAAMAQQQAAAKNAERASAYATPRANSFLGQGQASGLKASDTTWARDSETRMRAARQALADYDKQLNSTTASYSAHTSSLAGMLREEEAAEAALPRLRYALYDVSTTARTTALALGAVGIAMGVLAASQERAFANVERTLDPTYNKVEELRGSLMEMSREVPIAFEDLSAIATLGNQLGIAGEDIEEFTATVSRFSAVAGVSVEETAKAFGSISEIMDLDPSEFENLGSAIALVGRESVATEPEILSLVREIGQQANSAGFAADEVVALAGALGELRVPPERSRGALTTYFQTLNAAVAEGGDDLQNFAVVTGLTTEALSQMVRAGDGTEVFQRFLQGLGQAGDVVEVSQALDALGLQQLRVSDTFQRLASNGDVFKGFLSSSKQAFDQGTELTRQYDIILETISAKWQIFVNALAEAGGSIGEVFGPAIIAVLTRLTEFLHFVSDFAGTPIGAFFLNLAGTAGILVFAISGLIAITTGAAASFLAIRTAMTLTGTQATTLMGVLRSLSGALVGVATSGRGAAGGIALTGTAASKGGGALATMGRGLGGLAKGFGALFLIEEAAGWIFDFNGKVKQVNGSLATSSRAWSNFSNNGVVSIEMLNSPLGALLGLIATVHRALSGLDAPGQLASGFERAAAGGKQAGASFRSLKGAGDALDFDDWAFGAEDFAGGLDDAAGSAGDAADQIRTLVDYGNDLAGVMSRAFDIRFGGEQGLDKITSGWQNIRDAADAAREAAEEHQRTLASMGADRSIKQYWLSVAENYGDELRAAKLRAELAELDADMAKEKSELVKAQDAASMSLVGNSAAAIQNRANLLGLVGNYQEYLRVLAESGMSQADLQAESVRLRGEFVQQAVNMGYSRAEAERYSQSFIDMTTIINNVPRNITVTANADPALQALNEFVAAAWAAGASAGSGLGTGISNGLINAENNVRTMGARVGRAISDSMAEGIAYGGLADGLGITVRRSGRSGGREFADGGYTGRGGKNTPAGIVHKDEFVFSKEATSFYGPSFLGTMHEAGKAGKSMIPAGLAAAPGVVDLSAASVRALAHAIIAANPSIVLPGAQLAGSVGSHNVFESARGGS